MAIKYLLTDLFVALFCNKGEDYDTYNRWGGIYWEPYSVKPY